MDDKPDIGELVYVRLKAQSMIDIDKMIQGSLEHDDSYASEYSDEVTYGYISAYIETMNDGEDQWDDTLDAQIWAQITILDKNMPADLDMYSFTNSAGDLIIERPLDEWGRTWYMYKG